jgi:hypothetical protein
VLSWVCLAASIAGQDSLAERVTALLPNNARIIEMKDVSIHTAKKRALVLWMISPQRVVSTWDSAADTLYGDHWFGQTFLSLIDPSRGRLINTVTIRPDENWPDDKGALAIPFFTYDFLYYVPRPDKDRKGTPLLLNLRDLTGEGVAGQFVLFHHQASGIAAGTVLGYSSRSDTAVQYPVETTTNKFNPVVKLWAVQVFDAKPIRAGSWEFTWEPGHGSEEWIDEKVHFDPARQRFIEKMTTRAYPGIALVRCNFDIGSLPDFLGGMQRVALNGPDSQWLQGLITHASSNNIDSAGMVPTFNGTQQSLVIQFQVTATGAIGIEFTTDSTFAAALRSELRNWCRAN